MLTRLVIYLTYVRLHTNVVLLYEALIRGYSIEGVDSGSFSLFTAFKIT